MRLAKALPLSLLVIFEVALASPAPFPGPQNTPTGETTPSACGHAFSCHPHDNIGNKLLRKPGALSPSDPYSIFECLYRDKRPRIENQFSGKLERVCSYLKATGEQALSSATTHASCPSTALTCSGTSVVDLNDQSTSRIQLFSSQDENGVELKDEIPAYMPMLREHQYLKDNPA
ncbi:hypothetical protein DFP72DRAFT_911351 [Ephemerocybe angulata]|uniref:Uncharacterized protein n=1 Tax=Ephemerocybe angulata TaxID=980116 RepID=A0A8H6HPR0_9AGAR|nr:hypothetical protein DFP72DRAFT_911351 [Tulosesus angulatus]